MSDALRWRVLVVVVVIAGASALIATLLGGETLTDFALALLVGILVGTWSSVFTATPLAVHFERRSDTRDGAVERGEGRRVLVPAGRHADEVVAEAAMDRRPSEDTAGGATRTPPLPSAPRPRKRKGGKRR